MAARPSRLLNRDFVLLWQGQVVSQIGNQLHAIALIFWIKHATGSAALMGTLMMVSQLPGLLLGPLGGTLADRFSRRWIIIIADLARGLLVLSLAALLWLRPEETDLLVIWLFVTSIGMAIFSAAFGPAISASIPDLVPPEKIAAANSLSQSSYQLTTFLGQGMAGVLYRVLGAPVLFLIDGISYIVSAISECFIRIPQVLPEKAESGRVLLARFASETRAGFHHVWHQPGLRSLFCAAALLNFLFAPTGVLLPFYVEDHLVTAPGVAATPDWLGFMLAGLGLGNLIGYALAGVLRLRGRRRATCSIGALLLIGVGLGIAGMVHHAVAALAIFSLLGIASGLVNIGIVTTLQLTTPSEMRGRVFGLLGTLSGGLVPIGMGLAGVLADLVGRDVPLIYRVCGAAAVVGTLLIARSRSFREFLAYEPPEPATSAPA